MKAKIVRGGGFRGALNYVHDKGEAEIVGGNMSGQTPQELAREFGITKALRPDCKNPVWHCSLGLPEGDRLSSQKWDELSVDFMIEMGLDPSNFLYSVARHSDTEYDHIHIVASRIGLDGQLWHGQNDVLAAIKATQKLELKHSLTLTPGLDFGVKKERKSLTHAELNMAIRTETKPPRTVCQDAVDAVLQSSGVIPAPEFISRLAAFGVRAVPSVASTGTMNGFSFEAEGVSFTGSKLGDSFKWAQLQKRGIEYVKDRDFEELADARRSAAQRVADTASAGRQQQSPGRDSETSERVDSAAGPGSGASDRSIESVASDFVDESKSAERAGSIRQSEPGTAFEFGILDARIDESSSKRNGAENRIAVVSNQISGSEHWRVVSRVGSQHGPDERSSERDSDAAVSADSRLERFSDELEKPGGGAEESRRRAENRDRPSESAAPLEIIGGVGGSGNGGRVVGGGWASRFKQNSAAQRRENLGESDRARKNVSESDRIQARQIDPTEYLQSHGFDVKKEGRHLSVRQNGDEVYRCTLKDGHWVTCDRFENGIGDNIALVQELEPGTGFAESVYRLSGAPSVAKATRPAPAPAVRQPPQMPAQGAQDVLRGREYLQGRGITLETIEHAEKAGMLRYSAGGVLFVGRDEAGTAQNIMRRAVDASEAVQKRDLSGTDKRHPQMLRGGSSKVWIVEGGIDALALHDIAFRRGRPAPTVLVTGGANVKSWMQTPWVQAVLKLAKRVIVAFEREATPETQTKTDAAHAVQMQKLREVCSAEVTSWTPPSGVKDLAEFNVQHVQQAYLYEAEQRLSAEEAAQEVQRERRLRM